jgi:hypothetical protein
MNGGFWDLPAEERGHWYDKAERDTGQSFWDLPAEERGYYYDRAEENPKDGGPCTECWGSIADAALDRYAEAPAVWPDRTHDGQRMRDTETADVDRRVL